MAFSHAAVVLGIVIGELVIGYDCELLLTAVGGFFHYELVVRQKPKVPASKDKVDGLDQQLYE